MRTEGASGQALSAVRPLLASLAPSVPVVAFRTMDEQLAVATRGVRTMAMFAMIFAGLATLLAGVGLYAVLAYAVALRRREIGIRVALGASIGNVVGTVLRQLVGILAVGVATGGSVAVATGHVGQAIFIGVDGLQVGVLTGTLAVVLTMAALAAALPLRRALSVDPIETLRGE